MLTSFFKKRRKLSIFIMVLVAIFVFIYIFSRGRIFEKSELEYGTTFSKQQIIDLGLDWKAAYTDMLDDLGVRKLRISAYWNEIEGSEGKFDYTNLDWQVQEAEKRNVEIIMAVGGRLPRWPECHFPEWVKNAPVGEREERSLDYIKKTIERYRGRPLIVAWQIENEPFLSHFGVCPPLNVAHLDREISLVRSLDIRPVIVTDSGELSLWYAAAKRADIFGSTMYRNTYSSVFKSYIHYPILPGFFRFKKNIVSLFAHPKDWIVIELQAEPWCPVPYQNVTKEIRDKTMNYEKFKDMIEFSRKAGFKTFYLWGVEWWYWEKQVNHDPTMWNEAKKLFNNKTLR
jgi:hypothetical protein